MGDWLLTTPLMVWDVLALAGAPSDEILMCVGIDMLMILFGVVGAQTPEHQKWWFFIIGCLCFCHVVQTLLKYGRSNPYGEAARALYNKVATERPVTMPRRPQRAQREREVIQGLRISTQFTSVG